MEISHPKTANLKILFSDNYSDLQKEIIENYWGFKDFYIENSPKKCKEKYKLTQSQLQKIVKEHSHLSFYVFCNNCNSYEHREAFSISTYRSILNQYNYTCTKCLEFERTEKERVANEKYNQFLNKFNEAIDNKNWQNLSKFELTVLNKSLELNNAELKSFFGNILGQNQFIKLIKALESIEKQNLIFLTRNNYNNYIVNHKHLPRIKEHKDEIASALYNYKSTESVNTESNELKLKLTINDAIVYPDSPLYAGTIIFKERIIIEPNVEYVFGQWPRNNDNLYFTLVPLSNLEKMPEQKRISKQPISIKEAIADFFKSMDNFD